MQYQLRRNAAKFGQGMTRGFEHPTEFLLWEMTANQGPDGVTPKGVPFLVCPVCDPHWDPNNPDRPPRHAYHSLYTLARDELEMQTNFSTKKRVACGLDWAKQISGRDLVIIVPPGDEPKVQGEAAQAMLRNPKLQLITATPDFFKPKVAKVDPYAGHPYRLFNDFHGENEVFVCARARKEADETFNNKKKGGFTAEDMLDKYLAVWPRYRIATTDGAKPNPVLKGVVERPVAVRMALSPYKVFGFSLPKAYTDACGRSVNRLYIIGLITDTTDILAKQVKDEGQCANCMCETLILSRYLIQTTDGLAP